MGLKIAADSQPAESAAAGKARAAPLGRQVSLIVGPSEERVRCLDRRLRAVLLLLLFCFALPRPGPVRSEQRRALAAGRQPLNGFQFKWCGQP